MGKQLTYKHIILRLASEARSTGNNSLHSGSEERHNFEYTDLEVGAQRNMFQLKRDIC